MPTEGRVASVFTRGTSNSSGKGGDDLRPQREKGAAGRVLVGREGGRGGSSLLQGGGLLPLPTGKKIAKLRRKRKRNSEAKSSAKRAGTIRKKTGRRISVGGKKSIFWGEEEI